VAQAYGNGNGSEGGVNGNDSHFPGWHGGRSVYRLNFQAKQILSVTRTPRKMVGLDGHAFWTACADCQNGFSSALHAATVRGPRANLCLKCWVEVGCPQ
jgi:hypothetical protein